MISLLQGKHVAFAIFSPAHNRLHEALTAQGGHFRKTVTRATDLLVSSGRPCEANDRAKSLGIRIITQEEFERMLEGEPLPCEDVKPDAMSVNDAFGQARSVMQGDQGDYATMWTRLVSLIDVCEPESLAPLVSYINEFMVREGRSFEFSGHFSHTPVVDGSFRFFGLAPHDWYDGLRGGERRCQYRLIREFDLLGSGYSSVSMAQVLAHPDLTGLRRLCLTMSNAPTKKLVRFLCESKPLAGLRHLGLPYLHSRTSKYFSLYGQHARSIESLDLTYSRTSPTISHHMVEFVEELCSTPYFSTIKTLGMPNFVRGVQPEDVLKSLMGAGMLSQLEHIHVAQEMKDPWYYMASHLLSHSWIMARLKRISVSSSWQVQGGLHKTLTTCLSMSLHVCLEVLDLSGLTIYRTHDADDKGFAALQARVRVLMLKYFPMSNLLHSVTTLRLGPWSTSELRDALATSHPSLNVL